MKNIEDYLAAHPNDPDLAEMREKHRLMKGVMYWRLSESFKARLWNERRSVKELEGELKETQKRAVLVRQAREGTPLTTGGYASRVAAIRARIDQLHERLADVSERQNEFLQSLAIRELEGQKQRIETYEVQARYELAAIYDRTSNGPANPPKAPPAAAACDDRLTLRRRRSHEGLGLTTDMWRRHTVRRCCSARRRCRPRRKSRRRSRISTTSRSMSAPIRRRMSTAAKTMASYKRFLDLNAGDAALRAEALRRLGDLNLESSESERIERELATNEGLRATEAIHLYTALLKTYPKYERNDSVLYQLARAYELNAQPDRALASLDQLVAQYPGSHFIDEAQFRRGELLFSDKAYPKAQAAYEAVIKTGVQLRVLQPKPLQAWLVAVQAGRE